VSYKPHYSRFLGAHPERLHFAAHSHHPWPDVTRKAMLDCWDDAARLADRKWEHVSRHDRARAQTHIARTLDLSRPEQIAFAPNLHEFVCRLFSCLDETGPVRVLPTAPSSTASPVSSSGGRNRRGSRSSGCPTEPFATFEERFRRRQPARPTTSST
jgi:hypothetical protein